MRPPQTTLGELVKNARRAAGLTQESLAARAGLSARAISDLERRVNRSPRAATLQLLFAALSLSDEEREVFQTAAVEPAVSSATGPDAAFGTHGPLGATTEAEWTDLPRLIGRTREQSLLQRHLEGHGARVLVFAGEPGIGKTRLLQEAAILASAHGLAVLRGTVAAVDPLAVRDPVVDAITRATQECSPVDLRRYLRGCAWLVRAVPELASGPIAPLPPVAVQREHETALITRAVLRFTANVAGSAGTLLTLDNLQRADAGALALVARLAHAPTKLPFRVIAAYRDSELTGGHLSAVLSELAHERLVRHVTLTGLSRKGATTLLMELLGQEPTPSSGWLERVVYDTGGVPFYLVACSEDIHGSDVESATNEVPWTIRQSVRERVNRAAAPVRAVLEALAVADGRAAYPLLVALTAEPEVDVIAALEAAARARLIDEEGNSYQFAYEVIRNAVEADLSQPRRLVIRRRLAAFVRRDVHDVQDSAMVSDVLGESKRAARQTPSAADERAHHLAVLRGRGAARSRPRTTHDGT